MAEDDFEYSGEENGTNEIPALFCNMYGIVARRCRFCDVHLLCYHAARWMLTGANVYQGSLLQSVWQISFIM